jgi:4a-hydroxytetrahydrobiopterin dehydratase
MTETLASKTCTPCRGGIPPLTREQAEVFHAQAPDWQLAEEARRIERSFRFRNFREALTFVQEMGELAEAEGHHPNVSFGWGNATVSLQTKKIKGLHANDFIMATTAYSLAWLRHERVLFVQQLAPLLRCAPDCAAMRLLRLRSKQPKLPPLARLFRNRSDRECSI